MQSRFCSRTGPSRSSRWEPERPLSSDRRPRLWVHFRKIASRYKCALPSLIPGTISVISSPKIHSLSLSPTFAKSLREIPAHQRGMDGGSSLSHLRECGELTSLLRNELVWLPYFASTKVVQGRESEKEFQFEFRGDEEPLFGAFLFMLGPVLYNLNPKIRDIPIPRQCVILHNDILGSE